MSLTRLAILIRRMAYAIVKTGGKQYRVEQGQTLLVERLKADEGATVELEGAGHFIQEDSPDEIVAAVRDWHSLS